MVAAFLLGPSGLLPALAALLVWIDGGHGMDVSPGREGLSLVLHHGARGIPAVPAHSHSGLIQWFIPGAGDSTDDHVLSFSAAGTAELCGKHAPAAESGKTSSPIQEAPGHYLMAVFDRHGAGIPPAVTRPGLLCPEVPEFLRAVPMLI